MFSPLYLKIFEKSPFLMKTPTQNFAHHTEVKKHPFGVKTPILATLCVMKPSGLGRRSKRGVQAGTSGWTRSQLDLKGPWTRLNLSYRKKITEHDFGY